MKLKNCVGFLMGAAVMLTGCMSTSADEDEFSALTDYQYYSRTIGLETNDLLSPDMWEVYYSDIINLNKEIDGTSVYLIRLNPDKLLEIWAENSNMTADGICSELGTNRDELYYNPNPQNSHLN